MPDVLVMTATPIRTLALTTYGELDVTVMRDRPPGRRRSRRLRPDTPRRRLDVRARRAERRASGHVIYPLVEESEKIDARDVTAMADHCRRRCSQWSVGLLHGRARADAKQRVMDAFSSGALRLLVATTVVEVGVDVANATVIVVSMPGASGCRSCTSCADASGGAPTRPLRAAVSVAAHRRRGPPKAIAESGDASRWRAGSLLRGPGDVFGTRQAGMPTLRIGDLVRDAAIPSGRGTKRPLAGRDTADDPTLAGIRGGGPTVSAWCTSGSGPVTRMRIIAGTLKGRRLTPDGRGLRPTSDKLRETLFNVLQGRLPEARFLDVYAGTGAVGSRPWAGRRMSPSWKRTRGLVG